MAVIYLTHPVHGAKVATMDIEAEVDEKNGWIRYNSDTSSELVPLEEKPIFSTVSSLLIMLDNTLLSIILEFS